MERTQGARVGPAWRSLLPPVAKGSSAAAPGRSLRMDRQAEQLSFTLGNPNTSPHGPGGAPPRESGQLQRLLGHLSPPQSSLLCDLGPFRLEHSLSCRWPFCTTGGGHALSRSPGPASLFTPRPRPPFLPHGNWPVPAAASDPLPLKAQPV